jgi:hypothetical protein
MSERYPGGFVTKTPPTLNPALGNSTPGVWTLDQVMQNIKAGTWPAYDPYFEYTTLLLHGNGTNGAQNNTFLDSSTNNFTITRNGNTTQGTFTPYGSNWSNYFDGSSAALTTPSNSALSFGTGDFTAECFVFCPSYPGSAVYGVIDISTSNTTGRFVIDINTSGNVMVETAGVTIITASTTLPKNTWTHIAAVRSGTTLSLFQNGSRVGTATNSTNFSLSTANIAKTSDNYYFPGYISNVRLVKGTAVYDPAQTSLTVPTGPLPAITNTSLLTCQSNRFIDNSSNAFALTVTGSPSVQRFSPFNPTAAYSTTTNGGSGYFDGTGDSLSLASGSTALPTGTQDFCVEMWLYWQTQGGSYPQIISNPTTNGFQIYYDVASGLLAVGIFNVSNIITYTIAQTALSGAWTHLAVTRSGNTFRMFVNGVLRANGTNTISFASLTTQYIGSDGSRPYTGYMSDVRTVLGSIPTSYQTSSTTNGTSIFTPTSVPLTTSSQGATSGDVELLCLFTNGGIIDNAMMNDLETVGNAQISTTQSKFGGSSMYFDGNGDYLTAATTPAQQYGTGNFTIEFWFYKTANGSYNYGDSTGDFFLRIGNTGFTVNSVVISTNNSQQITAFIGYNGSSWATTIVSSSTFSLDTWYHVALVRAGTGSNQTTLYVNGTSYGTGTSSTDLTDASFGTALRIGASSSDRYYNGYIDDLRITKGIARYTSNFTPQTSQWQDQ